MAHPVLTDGGPVAALGVGGVLEVFDEHAGQAEGDVVVLGARQDRREALLVRRREVCAAPQQQLRRLHQAARRRQVQRTNLLIGVRGRVMQHSEVGKSFVTYTSNQDNNFTV